MSELSDAINEMRNMRESYDQIGAAAEAYNTGKAELAANITAKGVQASSTETLPELAEKVNAISQETYEINGGEMYAKQLFGSLETPNYWNLYDIMAQLLSDGRLVNYGGILLAEYYKGYDSLALSGAGAGGAYVVSDLDENGQFKMYTEDVTHVWNDDRNGKGNRWVAYCFANEDHDFVISNTNTSPRTIFIGRKVGIISCTAGSRVSQIIIPDGNSLIQYSTNTAQCNYDKHFVVRNLKIADNLFNYNGTTVMESMYIEAEKATGNIMIAPNNALSSIIVKFTGDGIFSNCRLFGTASLLMNCKFILIQGLKRFTGTNDDHTLYHGSATVMILEDLEEACLGNGELLYTLNVKRLYLPSIEKMTTRFAWGSGAGTMQYVYVGYKTNDRTKNVVLNRGNNTAPNLTDVELKDGYKKNLDVSALSSVLTAENIALHMLNRLADNTGEATLTLTIGSANLNRVLADETYASYVAAAQAKNWTIA